jgi:hypothetical protein
MFVICFGGGAKVSFARGGGRVVLEEGDHAYLEVARDLGARAADGRGAAQCTVLHSRGGADAADAVLPAGAATDHPGGGALELRVESRAPGGGARAAAPQCPEEQAQRE